MFSVGCKDNFKIFESYISPQIGLYVGLNYDKLIVLLNYLCSGIS